jgi:hypothetical protein
MRGFCDARPTIHACYGGTGPGVRRGRIGRRNFPAAAAPPFPEEVVLGQGTFPLQGKLVRANRDAHEALGREFSRLRLAESKPYALEWTMRRYGSVVKRYDDLARLPADARQSAAAGEPLPQPDELGSALSVAAPSGT